MSSDCEYKHKVIKFDKTKCGLTEDLFVLCALSGSSNLYSGRGNGSARVRKWEALAVGKSQEVMKTVIRHAGACEGASLYVGNFGRSGEISPEAYIRRLRGQISKAKEQTPDDWVRVVLSLYVFDHEVDGFDEARQALLSELQASLLPCGKTTGWAFMKDGSAEGQYQRMPAHLWTFPNASDVALFVKYQSLRQFSWPDIKVYGPGQV